MNICQRLKTLIMASSVLAIFMAASSVEAIITNYKTPAIGVADGQTMRVNVANVGTSDGTLPYIEFLGPDGNLLASFRPTESLTPGKAVSFDLARDSIADGGGRLELNVNIFISDPEIRSLRVALDSVRLTVEILDDATGKVTTFVAIGDPGLFSAK